MSEITYKPNNGENNQNKINEIMSAAAVVNGRRKKRKLYETDAQDLLDVLDSNPDCNTARSYSRDGFVANSYGYLAEIVCAEANRREDGSYSIGVRAVGAKRGRGQGALITVNGRGL